jgi:AraC-like DNA-binding protein
VRLVPGNALVHTVFIVATPAYLESLVTDCDPQIRALLESVRRNPDDTVIATERVTRTLRIALEQLQHCSAAGRLGQLYAEGKVFEILALHFEQLASGGQGCADEVRMSNSEVARIREARSVLLGRMQDPPSLTELARDVAISLKKLKVGFRHVYGETPFECLRHERLRLAKELLEEGDKQVSEVAYHVGYNSLSHFAVAFRQEFGACPHWYRHQAMTSAGRGRRTSDE